LVNIAPPGVVGEVRTVKLSGGPRQQLRAQSSGRFGCRRKQRNRRRKKINAAIQMRFMLLAPEAMPILQ
jgi:hypothetical protein